MENGPKQKVFKIISLAIDTLVFLVISYILFCCSYAFQMNPIGYIVFWTIDLVVFYRYYATLRKALFGEKKKFVAELLLVVAIWIASGFAVYFFANTFGYLEIAPMLKEIK